MKLAYLEIAGLFFRSGLILGDSGLKGEWITFTNHAAVPLTRLRTRVVVPPLFDKSVFCPVVIMADFWLTGRVLGESRIVGDPVLLKNQACGCSDLDYR